MLSMVRYCNCVLIDVRFLFLLCVMLYIEWKISVVVIGSLIGSVRKLNVLFVVLVVVIVSLCSRLLGFLGFVFGVCGLLSVCSVMFRYLCSVSCVVLLILLVVKFGSCVIIFLIGVLSMFVSFIVSDGFFSICFVCCSVF